MAAVIVLAPIILSKIDPTYIEDGRWCLLCSDRI